MKRATIRRQRPGISRVDEDRLLRKWLREATLPLEGIKGYRVRTVNQ